MMDFLKRGAHSLIGAELRFGDGGHKDGLVAAAGSVGLMGDGPKHAHGEEVGTHNAAVDLRNLFLC